MTIVYFSNFLTHHQKLVADELFKTKGIEYTFVEMVKMYDWLKECGWPDYSQVSYVLRAWESKDAYSKAIELAKFADVALFGSPEVLPFQIVRAKHTNCLSFDVSERWLKRGWINLLSPRLIKVQYYYHTLFYKKKFYKLCASAFAANDQYVLRSYKNRCYKWGYFTTIDNDYIINTTSNSATNVIRLMWCSRFLQWKHPELPILLASNLQKKGYRFILDIYGSGVKKNVTIKLMKSLGLEDYVFFKDNLPNSELLQEMRKHEIFLFTSDQNEGWGAVVNEAMSNGCALIGSDAVGSIPFLVEDGKTGLVFKSAKKNTGFIGNVLRVDKRALSSLTEKVEWIINNPKERKQIIENAYKSMRDVWSPSNAAKNLLILIEHLQNGEESTILNGPCSKAIPI